MSETNYITILWDHDVTTEKDELERLLLLGKRFSHVTVSDVSSILSTYPIKLTNKDIENIHDAIPLLDEPQKTIPIDLKDGTQVYLIVN